MILLDDYPLFLTKPTFMIPAIFELIDVNFDYILGVLQIVKICLLRSGLELLLLSL